MPNDARMSFGAYRLTFPQSEALYAVAIAAMLREHSGDRDLPRCRPSKRSSYERPYNITAHSASLRVLEGLGLIAQPLRRVWGESSDYGTCPVLTPEGRKALDSRWGAIVCLVTDMHLDAAAEGAERVPAGDGGGR